MPSPDPRREERNRRMAQAWRGGATKTEIAQTFGLSLNRTGEVLRRYVADLPTSGQGFKRDLDIDTVRGMYERGMTMRDIAEALDSSYGKIHRLLQAHDVPLRARGARPTTSSPS